MPILSIITINYNNSKGLQKTMQSVFKQSFKDFEYIVIDGGSTDESIAIMQQYDNKLAYRVSEKDKGIYDAMNKGIEKATGEYLLFLNSGDWLLDENVLQQFNEAAKQNRSAIYYGNIHLQKADNTSSLHQYPAELNFAFWENYTINHQASFIKRQLFKELGLYDHNYTLAADYAFFLTCFMRGKTFEHINKELVHYTLDGASSKNETEYQQKRRIAWSNIIPAHIQQLLKENNTHQSFMKHRLMRMAEGLQLQYSRIKKIFK